MKRCEGVGVVDLDIEVGVDIAAGTHKSVVVVKVNVCTETDKYADDSPLGCLDECNTVCLFFGKVGVIIYVGLKTGNADGSVVHNI